MPAVTAARLRHMSTADVAQGKWPMHTAAGQAQQHLNHMSTATTAHINTHLVLLLGVATNLKVLAPLQMARSWSRNSTAGLITCNRHFLSRQQPAEQDSCWQMMKSYLNGVHVHSLASLALQSQHDFLGGLCLQQEEEEAVNLFCGPVQKAATTEHGTKMKQGTSC